MSFKDILKQQQSGMEALATTGVIGLHLVSGPLVGFAIGYGLLLGIAAGFLNVYRDTQHLLKKMAAEDARRKGLSPTSGMPTRQTGTGAGATQGTRETNDRADAENHDAQP